eukprot:gnl/MRDRNA2_/MRDRNA2_98773_c0_seq1.p1 gnl/MRDRNA2_/MRDRNA2_98773_c0~~gnl/MRDRNA2_/MRDRNA2_98773_c0_seq1.p1  ORF type:complete len:143 (+),score=19.22 gnl/MRDRNA2_/MRDRNA2_98773_c0_seq1:55-483(+)
MPLDALLSALWDFEATSHFDGVQHDIAHQSEPHPFEDHLEWGHGSSSSSSGPGRHGTAFFIDCVKKRAKCKKTIATFFRKLPAGQLPDDATCVPLQYFYQTDTGQWFKCCSKGTGFPMPCKEIFPAADATVAGRSEDQADIG